MDESWYVNRAVYTIKMLKKKEEVEEWGEREEEAQQDCLGSNPKPATLFIFFKILFIYFREKEREGEGQGETHRSFI